MQYNNPADHGFKRKGEGINNNDTYWDITPTFTPETSPQSKLTKNVPDPYTPSTTASAQNRSPGLRKLMIISNFESCLRQAAVDHARLALKVASCTRKVQILLRSQNVPIPKALQANAQQKSRNALISNTANISQVDTPFGLFVSSDVLPESLAAEHGDLGQKFVTLYRKDFLHQMNLTNNLYKDVETYLKGLIELAFYNIHKKDTHQVFSELPVKPQLYRDQFDTRPYQLSADITHVGLAFSINFETIRKKLKLMADFMQHIYKTVSELSDTLDIVLTFTLLSPSINKVRRNRLEELQKVPNAKPKTNRPKQNIIKTVDPKPKPQAVPAELILPPKTKGKPPQQQKQKQQQKQLGTKNLEPPKTKSKPQAVPADSKTNITNGNVKADVEGYLSTLDQADLKMKDLHHLAEDVVKPKGIKLKQFTTDKLLNPKMPLTKVIGMITAYVVFKHLKKAAKNGITLDLQTRKTLFKKIREDGAVPIYINSFDGGKLATGEDYTICKRDSDKKRLCVYLKKDLFRSQILQAALQKISLGHILDSKKNKNVLPLLSNLQLLIEEQARNFIWKVVETGVTKGKQNDKEISIKATDIINSNAYKELQTKLKSM